MSPSGATRTDGALIGVMGIQPVGDVDLIRHAYVLPGSQGRGIGRALLEHLRALSARRILVGTWAAAEWAIRFYRRNGFEQVSPRAQDGAAADVLEASRSARSRRRSCWRARRSARKGASRARTDRHAEHGLKLDAGVEQIPVRAGRPDQRDAHRQPAARAHTRGQGDDREARPVPVVGERDQLVVAAGVVVAVPARGRDAGHRRLQHGGDPLVQEPLSEACGRLAPRRAARPRSAPPRCRAPRPAPPIRAARGGSARDGRRSGGGRRAAPRRARRGIRAPMSSGTAGGGGSTTTAPSSSHAASARATPSATSASSATIPVRGESARRTPASGCGPGRGRGSDAGGSPASALPGRPRSGPAMAGRSSAQSSSVRAIGPA